MIKIRLNKYLSSMGVCSRRSADIHVKNGEVKINNQIAKVGDIVDPEVDVVSYQHEIIKGSPSDLIYFAFYKPKGVITTKDDELHRKSVSDYIKDGLYLNPVGRLDKDSEGLLLLTNDGELTQELTHPKFEHEKEYFVEANMSSGFDLKDLGKLVRGVNIGGKKMKAQDISHVMIEKKKNLVKFNMILTTGHNRQIRRMCDKIGLSVATIIRIRIDKLKISDLKLKPGIMKKISKTQIV